MLFSLEVLPAKEGDCLLLHWTGGGKRRLAVIDGGPRGVFKNTLAPRLKEIAKGKQLTIEFVAVSHVDADHISGVDELFNKLAREVADGIAGNERPIRVLRLWHNAFNDILNDSQDALYKKIQASLTASGEPTPETQRTITATASARLGRDEGEHVAHDVSLILAGHAQGRSLRDSWQKLRDDNATGALNAPFKTDKGTATLIASHLTKAPVVLEDLGIRITGPLKAELDALQAEFDTFLKKEGLAVKDVLAAYADKSIPNLSSIVCVLSLGNKTMLLTGDARGDKVLAGLDEAGLLKNGKAHFHILKVPHHGSDRNTEAAFFKKLTADTYVLSADGKHGNPDRDTVEWIIDSRKDSDKYTIIFTYALSEIDKKRKEEAEEKGKAWTSAKNGLVPLIKGKQVGGFKFTVIEGTHTINLGDEKA